VPELPGRRFTGTVTRIADALQPGTRTLLTEIDIANPDGALQPGTYATAEILVPRAVPAAAHPRQAPSSSNQDGQQVAVVENGVARLRRITVFRDLGTEIEVREGVKAGDRVILNPAVDLRDGDRVNVAPSAAVRQPT
jgi:multidrug efflux pump subunit AcrA (membrane-fusion protein)